MTENRDHGFNIRFYFGVILLIVAAVLAFFALKKVDVDTLVKDNKFFTHYSAKDGEQLAVKITQITANPVISLNTEVHTYTLLSMKMKVQSQTAKKNTLM